MVLFSIPLALACIAGKVETGPGVYTLDILSEGHVTEHVDLSLPLVHSIERIMQPCT